MAKRFVVYGRVQGVGFRYFTWKEAEKIGIKGTVRIVQTEVSKSLRKATIDQLQYFYDLVKSRAKNRNC